MKTYWGNGGIAP